jgi:adenine-specific DNA methylase
VLDPAVGDGDFLLRAAERLLALGQAQPGRRLIGVDISQEAVSATLDALSAIEGPPALLTVRDFFGIDPPGLWPSELPSVDAVVGNPPYIRYQRFTGPARAAAIGRARDMGVRLSGLSSSWAPFVIHATSFLSNGGRLALVLPEELVHAAYASSVRAFLRRAFRRTLVIGFDGYLFPRSQERVVLVLAEDKTPLRDGVGQLFLANVPDPDDLDDVESLFQSAEVFDAGEDPEKWHVAASDTGTRLLDQLYEDGRLVRLRDIGKAGIGYVSGANDYFVLRPSEARRRGFPDEALVPTVLAARQVPGAALTSANLAATMDRDEPCLLWTGRQPGVQTIAQYISEGADRGIPQRYKCRVREPWYVVPGVTVPDAFLTYMSHEIPRLVLNSADATCSNNLLAVRFNSLNTSMAGGIVASFYNSATMLSAERIGRHYGGGVLKLEPSEADRLLIPMLTAQEVVTLTPRLNEVDALLRGGRVQDALAFGDDLVLRGLWGLDPAEVAILHDSWVKRRHVRAGSRLKRDQPTP